MRPLLPAFAALLALALPACGAAPEEPTATPSASEATPTAAPTPTAPPEAITLDDWYAMRSFQIAGEAQGLDYDGDGTEDNGIYVALDAAGDGIQDAVHEILYANVDYPAPGDPCEELGTCGPPPPRADEIEALVKNLVETYLTPEAINDALAAAFAGGAQPYALHLSGASSAATLDYWTGRKGADGYVLDAQIGSQSGAVNLAGGISTLGPGTYTFAVTLAPPQIDPIEVSFTVFDAITQLTYEGDTLSNAYTGGGIKIVELVDLVDSIIENILDRGEVPPGEAYDQALAALEQSLLAVSDITCDQGDPCVSVTFTYDADATALAP